ncbi:hypothetical protein E4T66_17185 [Sinimarinibacterium sp. CAU 1509]|uniref:hypothetical protein n=1 Tax=Sinimarinibacterium sp. CAU 1509 TaxID=2562283 RepID=UPI0010ACA081|nr:hypothetical protein [Sinimarinibacterium sp. CAU 1509]TJY57145.1 hypothetical protein E4T66_17185 [Sinimarinibacterium sp. CAU 1509]
MSDATLPISPAVLIYTAGGISYVANQGPSFLYEIRDLDSDDADYTDEDIDRADAAARIAVAAGSLLALLRTSERLLAQVVAGRAGDFTTGLADSALSRHLADIRAQLSALNAPPVAPESGRGDSGASVAQ